MKKIVKAEMWDRMQFLFRNFYDRMIHVKLQYKGSFDLDRLKSAIVYMIEKAPILHSSFVPSQIKPYWRKNDYTIDDIFEYEKVSNASDIADEWLLGVIPYSNKVQIAIRVFEDEKESILTIRVNHMCMDGGDLKYFVATLVENYNRLALNNYNLQMKTGSRSHTEVYTKFDEKDYKKANNLYKNIAKSADKIGFPWSPDSTEDKNQIIKRVISEEEFNILKTNSKKMGITINDAIMAMVFRSIYEINGLSDNTPITISGAIDLRKHIKNAGLDSGLANHTAWMALRTLEKGATMQDTIINVIRATKVHKRDKFMGLYSLPLLKLAFTIFPPAISEFAIKLGYSNPLLAVSNIGLLDEKKLSFIGLELMDGFMSGAVKYKPFFLMSLTTLKNKITLSTAIRGRQEDIDIANKFFDLMIKNLREFNEL